MPICSLPECAKGSVAKGYCVMHYKRWRKHGDPRFPAGRGPVPVPRAKRLLRLRRLNEETGCWEFTGARHKNGGYGVIRGDHNGHTHLAHRSAWAEWKGPIPEGAHVRHRCNNVTCFNPDHLFLWIRQADGDTHK